MDLILLLLSPLVLLVMAIDWWHARRSQLRRRGYSMSRRAHWITLFLLPACGLMALLSLFYPFGDSAIACVLMFSVVALSFGDLVWRIRQEHMLGSEPHAATKTVEPTE